MTHFSLRSSDNLSEDTSDHPDELDHDWELRPDDRVGAPLRRGHWRRRLRRGATLVLLSGLGWSYASDGPVWSGLAAGVSWAAEEIAAMAAQPTRQPPSPGTQASATPQATPTQADAGGVGPGAPTQSGVAPEIKTTEVVPSQPPPAGGDEPTVAKEDGATVAASQPYTPASSDARTIELTALQKRAVAAGLHPDLSTTLLEKLSRDDYRNARAAVDAALAPRTDGQAAKKPSRGIVTFSVHFVAGAGEGCRRYVVTIAKAGWETTAPPMESCGGRFIPVRS